MCEVSDIKIKDFCSVREQTEGYQRGGALGDWVTNVTGLGSTIGR